MAKPQILILGGTTEARILPTTLPDKLKEKYDIVTSFSGVTKSPRVDAGSYRLGGFGGVTGLSTYLEDHNVILLIDATHPFAKEMPHNAYQAAQQVNCPILKFSRPAWEAGDDDNWIYADTLQEAAKLVHHHAEHAFLSLGSRDLSFFKDVHDLKMTARMIEKADPDHVPQNCDIILSRPPFSLEQELNLFSTLAIDLLVTKNSGAKATKAKLTACRQLGIKVLMVHRPKIPPVPVITHSEALLTYLREDLNLC